MGKPWLDGIAIGNDAILSQLFFDSVLFSLQINAAVHAAVAQSKLSRVGLS
jgi:hypothetical protein